MTHDLSNIPHKTQYIQLRKDLQAFLTEEKLTVPHISAGKFFIHGITYDFILPCTKS